MDIGLLGIFGAGLLTFASPCILPLVPIYLALLGGASADELARGSRIGRTVAAAGAFTLGLSLVFVGMGLAATFLGRALVAHRTLLLQLGGLAVFLFGLKYLGVLHLPWLEREYRPLLARRAGGGLVGGFVLGATFGLGWTPCIGPVLGSVLTYTASTATSPASGALHLGAYALGLSLPLLAVAAVAPLALRWLKRLQRWMQPMQIATGVVLALVGLLLITDKLGALDPTSFGSHESPVALAAADGPPVCGEPVSGSAACGLPEGAGTGAVQSIPAGPAMVEFVSGTCPICLKMAPVVAAAERGCAGQGLEIAKIRVDLPGGLALARRHGVIGVPTFVFLDGSNQEAARLVGEQSLATIEQTLQVLTGGSCDGFRAFPPAPEAPAAPEVREAQGTAARETGDGRAEG